MKRSDLNHLRRLVAWVKCEIGQSPDEMVKTMRNLAERGITTDAAGKARMVQAYDAARSVPKYVRDAVKALDRYARPQRCHLGGALNPSPTGSVILRM